MRTTLRRILSVFTLSLIVAGFVALAHAHHDTGPQAPRGLSESLSGTAP